ncbi:MAG: isoprenylcysteine carboxylmethyltransferase family protein [Nitrospirae bacterium]|nr:isoprenylcysteine carboxylmethyltransferase family protein [Nitrospirota bacterium]
MNDLLALTIIIFWLIIPLFWIPVHYATSFLRKIGLLTYAMPLFTWLPLSYLIYKNKSCLFEFRIDMPEIINFIGILILITGTLLHIWTARLLGLWGIIGVPEIITKTKKHFVTKGPFSIVRHPTYLAHTCMFSGAFFITGVMAVGIITILDFLTVTTLIIPLEEKELASRYGKSYQSYRKKVPYRLIPRLF